LWLTVITWLYIYIYHYDRHMIVTRTRLCTRLVILLGYTPRHLLFVTVVLLVLYLYSYSCYCYSVAYVSCYLIILYLQLFLLLLYAPCLYARALPFTHTLTRSLSDDPGFARPDIGRLFYCADVRWDCTTCEEPDSLSLFWFWYSFLSLFLLLFFDSCISPLASILFLISFQIMCSLYMYYCSDPWLLWFRFIACSGYFRLSAYTWGIFLAYMRRRLVSRLRSSVFWEAGRDRVFLVSEPGST